MSESINRRFSRQTDRQTDRAEGYIYKMNMQTGEFQDIKELEDIK